MIRHIASALRIGLNADLGKANTTVSPYDIDSLKARQESAAALSELLNGMLVVCRRKVRPRRRHRAWR